MYRVPEGEEYADGPILTSLSDDERTPDTLCHEIPECPLAQLSDKALPTSIQETAQREGGPERTIGAEQGRRVAGPQWRHRICIDLYYDFRDSLRLSDSFLYGSVSLLSIGVYGSCT